MSPCQPPHPAICHRIVNSPNPWTPPISFPTGDSARLVLLGDHLPYECGKPDLSLKDWWPCAASDNVKFKLFRRILREGYVLPSVAAIAFALLSTMYTTDSQSPRVRLRAGTELIEDFGVMKGSVRVTSQDQLAYLFCDSGNVGGALGQDPDHHYWLYFTTASGEDIFLDCAMFTFNLCIMVPSEPYFPRFPGAEWVPGLYVKKELSRMLPLEIHTEKQRFSFLRNSQIRKAASQASFEVEELKALALFVHEMAGVFDRDWFGMLHVFTKQNLLSLNDALRTKSWQNWPASPDIGIDGDPGEMVEVMRRVSNGEMTCEEAEVVFKNWKKKQYIYGWLKTLVTAVALYVASSYLLKMLL